MSSILPGTQVLARNITWEVVQVEPAGAQQRFRLRCTHRDLLGMELDLLSPFETIEPISSELDPTRPGRLRNWRLYHDAFLLEQSLGPASLLTVQPGRLDLAPYQLVPLMRVLQMSRPRLLLADGVGLGKTIEAGLILAELLVRRRVHRILIVTPAGPLLRQWRREMHERFGLRFETISSSAELQELRRSLPLGANPFDRHSLCLMSVDFAKQERVLQDLERSHWDLVVIDEAHHCVRLGEAGDREDSRRRHLAEVLARRCDGLLLLTATPHDGFDAHFASLLELMDPSLVNGRGSIRGEGYRRHVVRRLKRHITDPLTGAPLFPDRQVTPCPVAFTLESHEAFAAMQQALLAMIAPRLQRALRTRRYGDVLAFLALLKRSVSSAAACRNTLQVIHDRYQELATQGRQEEETRRQRQRALRDYQRRLERFGATSPEDEQTNAELEAEDVAADLLGEGLEDVAQRLAKLQRLHRREGRRLRERAGTAEVLESLVELAAGAMEADPKLEALLAQLRAIRVAEPHANVIVYTEYTDSQDALVEHLQAALARGELSGEILAISGRSEQERERDAVIDRFTQQDDLVLVSTDATAEGLNLHERCHHLIHLELPYNPNRLEQRNGRIDRYGQRETPQVRYLYLGGTFEERLLMRLVAKYEKQRLRLTFMPDTLGGITSDDAGATRLLQGLVGEEDMLFQRPAFEIRHVDGPEEDLTTSAYRELLEEVSRALTSFENSSHTHTWLAESGLGAETRLVREAEQAREEGARQGLGDLQDFVLRALQDEGPTPPVRHPDGRVELHLPSTWTRGSTMDGMPGFDPETRILRLTTDKSQLRDEQGRRLGYLGRAHPVVRRAIDQVRNLRHGEAGAWLDRRVSAVAAPLAQPGLFCTFLCQTESEAGHEVERVMAALVDARGHVQVMDAPASWPDWVTRGGAIDTTGLWDVHFADWGAQARERAAAAVQAAFLAWADTWKSGYLEALSEEVRQLELWLRERTEELCGRPEAVTADLFAGDAGLARWRGDLPPRERLQALTLDDSQSSARRHEAKTVLALLLDREEDVRKRRALRLLDPAPLGLLMAVPTTAGGR